MTKVEKYNKYNKINYRIYAIHINCLLYLMCQVKLKKSLFKYCISFVMIEKNR